MTVAYRKSEGWSVNASDRPACQAITDRGFAMIPLGAELWTGGGSGASADPHVGVCTGAGPQ